MATNYQFNPNFTTDASGWFEEGSDITQVTDVDFTPGTAMQIVATLVNNGASMNQFEALALPGFAVYTFRFEHQLEAGAADQWYVSAVAIDVDGNGLGAEVVNDPVFTPSGTVAVHECTIELDTANGVKLKPLIWKFANTGESTLRVSAMELLAPVTLSDPTPIRTFNVRTNALLRR